MVTPPFFAEFRLIVIEDLFSTKSEDINDKSLNKLIDDIVLALDNIPENNIIIFVARQQIKSWTLFEKIKKIWSVKEFPILDGAWLRKKALLMDSDAVDRLITLKQWSLDKIDSEIDKLLLYKLNERITVNDINTFVNPDIDVSIFDIIDDIYWKNPENAINKIRSILEQNKPEPILAALMSNIRKLLYILYLESSWYSDNTIVSELKLHPFVVQKSLRNKSRHTHIKKIFDNLIQLDFMMKTWLLIWDLEHSFRMALEKMILDLKNEKNHLEWARF